MTVPGALVALARPRTRGERAFSAITAGFLACLLLQAGLFGANGLDRFEERYLFTLLPLVPVAFGLYLSHGRPHRTAVAILAGALVLVALRAPVSSYAAGLGRSDSPFLLGIYQLEDWVGTANGALVVLLVATLAAAGAVVVSRRGAGVAAICVTIALAVLVSAATTISDLSSDASVAQGTNAADPSWVDSSGLGDVTLVQTLGSPIEPRDRAALLEPQHPPRGAARARGAHRRLRELAACRNRWRRHAHRSRQQPPLPGLRRDGAVRERVARRAVRDVLTAPRRRYAAALAARTRSLRRRLARPLGQR